MKAPRGPGGDDHAGGVDAQPVAFGVEPRDALAQGRKAERGGVAERPLLHRPGECLPRARGGGRAGLADLHVDDPATGRLLGRPRGPSTNVP